MIIDKSKYVRDYGVKDSKVSNWMQRHWTKGLHYFVIGRTTMIDVEEVNRWIRQNTPQELTSMEIVCGSEYGKKESLRTKKRSPLTLPQKLTFDGLRSIGSS